MTKARRLHKDAATPRLNIRGIGLFLNRLSIELDTMRGRIFDHERMKITKTGIADQSEVDRLVKLSNARDLMYHANKALLEAQAALLKL